jgi:hypothetical protein
MIYARPVMGVIWNRPYIIRCEYNEILGFGASVLSTLIKTKIKRNLYYEIKDRVFEERAQGITIQKVTKSVKVYGYDETKKSREVLMEILRDRMDNHKSKFISPIIYNELCTLEVKKNGRIEHSDNAHDDQIFSYLLALYIWYEGKNLMERYGLEKGTIDTDDDSTVEFGVGEDLENIVAEIDLDDNEVYSETKAFFNQSVNSKSFSQWEDEQRLDNERADEMLRNDPRTRDAWYKHNHLDPDGLGSSTLATIPNSVFDEFYDIDDAPKSDLQRQFDNITDLR